MSSQWEIAKSIQCKGAPLPDNRIKEEAFTNNIEELNLNHCGLTEMPDVIDQFPKLTVLHLIDNRIEKIKHFPFPELQSLVLDNG